MVSCRDWMVPFQVSRSSFTHGCWCTQSQTYTLAYISLPFSYIQVTHSIISSFIYLPFNHSIRPKVLQVHTSLAVRQISASHVQSPLLVHSISADPFVGIGTFLSSPSCFPFICGLSTHLPSLLVFPTLVVSVWSSYNPMLHIVQLAQNKRHEALWFGL